MHRLPCSSFLRSTNERAGLCKSLTCIITECVRLSRLAHTANKPGSKIIKLKAGHPEWVCMQIQTNISDRSALPVLIEWKYLGVILFLNFLRQKSKKAIRTRAPKFAPAVSTDDKKKPACQGSVYSIQKIFQYSSISCANVTCTNPPY